MAPEMQGQVSVSRCADDVQLAWRALGGLDDPTVVLTTSGTPDVANVLQPHELPVVTGVFCNTAIESATIDKDVATIKQVQAKAHQVEHLKHIFQEIDRLNVNEVSFQDVQEAISSGELSSFMEAVGISTDDVWTGDRASGVTRGGEHGKQTLCMLLDADKNGTIDLDEFVAGCMQLHGPAKSLQIAKMSFENKLTRQAIRNLGQETLDIKTQLETISKFFSSASPPGEDLRALSVQVAEFRLHVENQLAEVVRLLENSKLKDSAASAQMSQTPSSSRCGANIFTGSTPKSNSFTGSDPPMDSIEEAEEESDASCEKTKTRKTELLGPNGAQQSSRHSFVRKSTVAHRQRAQSQAQKLRSVRVSMHLMPQPSMERGWFNHMNTVIVLFFVLEIVLKFMALGCWDFWFGEDGCPLNGTKAGRMDQDVALDFVTTAISSNLNTGQLRLVRSIRLARALRSMRVMRLFRYVSALRTLVLLVIDHCRYNTIESTGDTNAIPTCEPILKMYWSEVPESMLTLFMAITGGVSWDDAVRPLRDVSMLALALVIFYAPWSG
eukprot:g5157.t1